MGREDKIRRGASAWRPAAERAVRSGSAATMVDNRSGATSLGALRAGLAGGGVVQPKWILRDGVRVWVPDDHVLAPNEKAEGPIRGVPASPHTVARPPGPRPPAGPDAPFPFAHLPPSALGALVDLLPPRDLANLHQADREVRGPLAQTGHDFMHPIYEAPAATVPQVLPSVQDWAQGQGPPADPSAKAELIYKMAALDPLTKLDTGLGKGSTGGKKFLSGGGFFAHQEAPAETQEQANARNLKALESYQAAKKKMEDAGKAFAQPAPAPKPPKPQAPTNTGLEYHPGGGIHSARKSEDDVETFAPVPPSATSGGSYIKVEKPSTKANDFRFARFGPFTSGKDMGYYWDPMRASTGGKAPSPLPELGALRREMPAPDAGPEAFASYARGKNLTTLTPPQLLELGSRAETAGLADVMEAVTRESQRRMAERLTVPGPKPPGPGPGDGPPGPDAPQVQAPQGPQAPGPLTRGDLIVRGRARFAELLVEWRGARGGRDAARPPGYDDRLAAVESIDMAPPDITPEMLEGELNAWIDQQRQANARSNV